MKLKLFILVLGLQTAWLLGTVAQQEHRLQTGQTVLLEAQPVDPRDPLRGDFVRLGYAIGDVPREQCTPPLPGEVAPGTRIFVALAPGGLNGCWQFVRASLQPIPPADNEVVLRGTSTASTGAGSIHVDYGIEKYFVAEGTGHPSVRLTVQVAVAKSGQASIKQVFVDGKPYAEVVGVSR